MRKTITEIIKSYSDKHPSGYSVFIILIAFSFFLISTVSFYKSSTRVYSGTTYLALPSHFYITKPFIANKIITTQPAKTIKDTITTGSFLISVNEENLPGSDDLFTYLEHIAPDSVIKLCILNLKFVPDPSAIFKKTKNGFLADTFKVKRSDLPEDFIRVLRHGVLIGGTEFKGATYNSGVKPGDVLLTAKNRVFKMKDNSLTELSPESIRFLRSHKGGEILPFKVLRNNEIMTFDVTLATLGIDIAGLLSYCCGLIFLFTGLFYSLKKPRIFASGITGFAFLILGLLFSFSDGLNSSSADLLSMFITIVLNTASFFMFPILFHSLAYFPKEHPEFIQRKWTILIPYYSAAFASLSFFFFFFTDFGLLYDSVFSYISFINILNILFYLVTRFVFRRKTSPEYKKATKIIIITVLSILAFDVFVVLLQMILGQGAPGFLQYSFILLLILPASYIYTTWRYSLLDIDFHIRMNVKYNLITVLLNTVIFILFTGMLYLLSSLHVQFPNLKHTSGTIEYLPHALDPAANTFYEKVMIMLLILLFSFFYFKIIKYFKEGLAKKFYRQKFDYKLAQSELIKLFETKRELKSLARSIVEQLSELVHLKRLGIVFFNSSITELENYIFSFDKLLKKHLKLEPDIELFDEINQFNSAFDVEYLHEESKAFLLKSKLLKVIPIRTDGKLIAALFVGEKLSETPLNNVDIEFLISISKNFSVAIENAFLYEELAGQQRIKQELAIARRIQLSSLPQDVPKIEGLQISAVSIPAYEVGGDFYDFLNGSADDVTIIIGDVSGKGTSAALYMSKVQGIFQTLHEFYTTPFELLNKANKMIFRNFESNSFITAISANINTEKKIVSFSRAGHLPLYHFKLSQNNVEKVTPRGIGLGLCKEDLFKNSLEEKIINYSTGDIFLFFSDGIIESKNKAGDQFGEERLVEVLINNSALTSKNICDKIINDISVFSEEVNQFDDITLVVVKTI